MPTCPPPVSPSGDLGDWSIALGRTASPWCPSNHSTARRDRRAGYHCRLRPPGARRISHSITYARLTADLAAKRSSVDSWALLSDSLRWRYGLTGQVRWADPAVRRHHRSSCGRATSGACSPLPLFPTPSSGLGPSTTRLRASPAFTTEFLPSIASVRWFRTICRCRCKSPGVSANPPKSWPALPTRIFSHPPSGNCLHGWYRLAGPSSIGSPSGPAAVSGTCLSRAIRPAP